MLKARIKFDFLGRFEFDHLFECRVAYRLTECGLQRICEAAAERLVMGGPQHARAVYLPA
jgi:hypothetical protein